MYSRFPVLINLWFVLKAIKAHFYLASCTRLGSLYKPDNLQVLQKLTSLPFNDFHLLSLPLIWHRNAELDYNTYVWIYQETYSSPGKQTDNNSPSPPPSSVPQHKRNKLTNTGFKLDCSCMCYSCTRLSHH